MYLRRVRRVREHSLVVLIVSLIALLLFFATLTANRWPSPGFIAFILSCWLVYVLVRRR